MAENEPSNYDPLESIYGGIISRTHSNCISSCCEYSKGGVFEIVGPDDKDVILEPQSMIKLNMLSHPREQAVFAYFPHEGYKGDGGVLRVSYAGEDARSMRKTIDKLGIPTRWPENLGDKIFHIIREKIDNAEGPIYIEQAMKAGRIHQIERVVGDLAGIYVLNTENDILPEIRRDSSKMS
ncbi:MAG: hypothetical protein R6U32_02355 [Candidatus Woesearchaeota archaeon]